MPCIGLYVLKFIFPNFLSSMLLMMLNNDFRTMKDAENSRDHFEQERVAFFHQLLQFQIINIRLLVVYHAISWREVASTITALSLLEHSSSLSFSTHGTNDGRVNNLVKSNFLGVVTTIGSMVVKAFKLSFSSGNIFCKYKPQSTQAFMTQSRNSTTMPFS